MSSIEITKVDYATLEDIDDLPRISEKDEAVLKQLEEVILKHGQENRIGVVLIHKHFNVAASEVAVERVDVEKRVSVIQVEQDTGNPDIIPSMLRFRKAEPVPAV